MGQRAARGIRQTLGQRGPLWTGGILVASILMLRPVAGVEVFSPPPPAAQTAAEIVAIRGIVAANANLRHAPSLHSDILATVRQGTLVQIVAEQGQWAQVLAANGVKGWLYKPLIRQDPESPGFAAAALPEVSPPTGERPDTARTPPSIPSAVPPPAREQAAPPPPAAPDPGGMALPSAPTAAPLRRWLDALGGDVPAVGLYVIAGLVSLLILAIALQLRAASQLKRGMRDMQRLMEAVEELSAEQGKVYAFPREPSPSAQPLAAAAKPPSRRSRPLMPVEAAVLEALSAHDELREGQLAAILAARGFPGVLVKAVVGELIRKSEHSGLPRIEVRYTQGRYTYRLPSLPATDRPRP
jgi:hypothetical protein